MTLKTQITRGLRMTSVAALAAATLMVLPASAGAGPRPYEIADRLDRIAYRVERVREIRNPYRQDARIDALQDRLRRLEWISEHQRGRLARANERRIDRLQHRLHRMERRAERRIDRRERRRHDRGRHWAWR